MKYIEVVMCRINIEEYFFRDAIGKISIYINWKLFKERDNSFVVGWDVICCLKEKFYIGRYMLKNRTKVEGEIIN